MLKGYLSKTQNTARHRPSRVYSQLLWGLGHEGLTTPEVHSQPEQQSEAWSRILESQLNHWTHSPLPPAPTPTPITSYTLQTSADIHTSCL